LIEKETIFIQNKDDYLVSELM